MRTSDSKPIISEQIPDYIQKGYFVDYFSPHEGYADCQIQEIIDSKVYLRNWVTNTKISTIDICEVKYKKLRPFRELTKPAQIMSHYHKTYCYWGLGIVDVLHFLQTINSCANIKQISEKFTNVELQQNIRGRVFYIAQSLRYSQNFKSYKDQLSLFISEFLTFSKKYYIDFAMQYLNSDCNSAQQLKAKATLRQSYQEMIFSLSSIFNRNSFPMETEGEERQTQKKVDNLMKQQLVWIKQQIIHSINLQRMKILRVFELLKLNQIITKLIKLNRIERTEQVYTAISNFFSTSLEHLLIIVKKEYDEYQQIIKKTLENLQAWPQLRIKVFEVRCQLFLKFHGSWQNKLQMHYSEKSNYINKHITFIYDYLEKDPRNPLYQQKASKFSEVVTKQYLENIYTNPVAISKQLKKLFKFDSDIFISVITKIKKFIDVLKVTQGQWTIEQLIKILKQMMSTERYEKQEFLNSITLYKFVINQLLEKKNGGISSYTMVSSLIPESHRSSGELIKFVCQRYENGSQFKQAFFQFEDYIIRISEKIFDEKTPLFDYIKQVIIPRYITRWRDKISGSLQEKQTNLFRQQFIIHQFINKSCNQMISPAFPLSQQEKNQRITSIFQQLTISMTYLRLKSKLEARKQNIKSVLQKSHRILDDSQKLVDLIIFYVDKLSEVINKQFRNKGYDEIILNQFGQGESIFKSLKDKIRGQKRIMETIYIQNLSSYKLFIDFFKFVNTKQFKMKLVEDSPTFICQKPFGLINLLQVFQKISDKSTLYKVQAFFEKLPAKMVQFQQKRQTIKQVILKILQLIKDFKSERSGLQSPKQLVKLLESIIFCEYSLQLNNIYESTFQQFTRKDMIYSSYINGARTSSLTPIKNANVLSEYNPSKKISVQIRIFRDQSSFQEQKQEKKVQNINLDVSGQDKLYQLKLKCCKLSYLNTFATTIYAGSKRYFHQQEVLSIQQIYSDVKKEEDKVKETESHEKQGEDNENQLKTLKICLVEDKSTEYFLQIIKQNRKLVFDSLPYTKKIWEQLQINNEDWRTDKQLISIKQSFINYFGQQSRAYDEMKDEGARKSSSAGLGLDKMNQSFKKMIILKVLMQDQDIINKNSEWIFKTFTPVKDKVSLQSNIFSVQLLQKFKPTIKIDSFRRLMAILYHNSQNQFYSKQEKSQYQNYLACFCSYVLDNSDFILFQQLMNDFYQVNPHEGCQMLKRQLNALKVRAFMAWIENSPEDFQGVITQQCLCPEKIKFFDKFVKIISKRQFEKYLRTNDGILKRFNIWLDKMVKICNENRQQMMMQKNTFQAGLILRIICFLLNREATSKDLYTEQWMEFMKNMQNSHLFKQSLQIITCISKEDKIFAAHFTTLFLQKLYDSDLFERQQIKYNFYNKRHESGFVGLRNPHSICYANSLLQQLYHIKPFRSSLFECEWKREKQQRQDLIYQIKKIFVNLQYKQSEYYYNPNFFHAFKNYEGQPTNVEIQMDADEFRIILLDRIESLLIKKEGEKNFLQKFLMGKQVTRVKCMQCFNQSIKEEDFHSINIPIKGMKDLLNSLKENYYKPQILNDQNKYDCQKCKKKVVAEKTHQIKQYPPYLTFVLKRFDYVSYFKKKVNERFQFPLESFSFGESEIKYRLKGIIVHQGLSQSGHYFSYIKQNDCWYEINDNTVIETELSEVGNDSFGESSAKSTRNAYLLFYEMQENKMVEQQMDRISKNDIKMVGIQKQFNEVQRLKQFYRKIQLVLCQEFNNYVQTVVTLEYPQSFDLLLMYFISVKSKYKKYYPSNFQQTFQLLARYCFQPILSSQLLAQLVYFFYKNGSSQNTIVYDPHVKKQMTRLIVSTYEEFNFYYELFIGKCIQLIHLEIQTGPIYELLYLLAKKDQKVLNFIISQKIVGRIYDLTIPTILFTNDRKVISEMCNPPFKIICDEEELSKKKKAESNQYRYMKWRLLNFIIESNLKLQQIQQKFVYNWADRRCQHIFQQATSKANINQISRFFCNITIRNFDFGKRYLEQICEQLSKEWKEKGQMLRKYMKSASDLLDIEDSYQEQRVVKIGECFRQSFKNLCKMKVFWEFDIKWQWFLKIAIRNKCFRRYIKSKITDYRILLNKPDLLLLYSKSDMNADIKLKNRLYGLKFQTFSYNSNFSYLDIKIQKTRNILNEDQRIDFVKEEEDDRYWDTDLTTFSEQIPLSSVSQVMKYNQSKHEFEKVKIEQVLGDSFKVGDHTYFLQSERFIHLPQNIRKKNENEKEIQILKQNAMEMQNQFKVQDA